MDGVDRSRHLRSRDFAVIFIQGFSKIAGLLTLMLQTTGSLRNLPSSMHVAERDEVGTVGCSSDCEDEMIERSPYKNSNGDTGYLTPKARLVFTKLRKAFNKAPIIQHFDSECHIRIETDASRYAIDGVLSQLTLDNLGRWHPVACYSQKIIPAETQYKTHDGELLAIVEAFKRLQHYLKICKHKVLVLTDHNNLRRFMDMKSLSFRQVHWARSSPGITFGLIIARARRMGLQMHCLVFFRETRMKKKSFELRTLEFFIVCSPH